MSHQDRPDSSGEPTNPEGEPESDDGFDNLTFDLFGDDAAVDATTAPVSNEEPQTTIAPALHENSLDLGPGADAATPPVAGALDTTDTGVNDDGTRVDPDTDRESPDAAHDEPFDQLQRSATGDGSSQSAASVWDSVIGQPRAVSVLRRAVSHPVHAYLFVGPAGCGKTTAARAFAAQIIAGVDDPEQRDVALVMRGEHPDVAEVERSGATISAEQAREVVRTAALAPVEGPRKVIVLHEFHLLRPDGAAILLKTIEEPPASTIIVVLADLVPSDLITISSRCARVDFGPVDDDRIAELLLAEGVDQHHAVQVAAAAGGSVDRARVLATDPQLSARLAAFASVPQRVDGSGATAARLTDELVGLIEAAAEVIQQRHEVEVGELNERIARYGERGSGKKRLEDRHRRELRRHRTDELLAGLGAIAATYRDGLADGSLADVAVGVDAVRRLHDAMEAFEFNPNESLLLQSLLWALPPVPTPLSVSR